MSLYKIAKEKQEEQEQKKPRRARFEPGLELETGRLFGKGPVGLSGSIGIRKNREGEDASLKDRLYFGANATTAMPTPEGWEGLKAYIPGARLAARANPFRGKGKKDPRLAADFVRDHSKGIYKDNRGEYNKGLRGVSLVSSADPKSLGTHAVMQGARDLAARKGFGQGEKGFGAGGTLGRFGDALLSARLGASSGSRYNVGETKDIIDYSIDEHKRHFGSGDYDEDGYYTGGGPQNTPDGKNPYAGMTKAEAKKQYRKDAMKHHPDRGGDADKFKHVASWYDHLDRHGFDKEAMAFFMSFFM